MGNNLCIEMRASYVSVIALNSQTSEYFDFFAMQSALIITIQMKD